MPILCGNCGVQNVDDHRFCKACGCPLTAAAQQGLPLAEPKTTGGAPAAEQIASSLQPPTGAFTAIPNRARKLQGVGGWLLFFCVSLTVINPLMILGEAGNSKNPFVITVDLALTVFSIYTGITVWLLRPNSFKWLRVFFLVQLVLGAMTLASSIPTGQSEAEYGSPSSSALTSGIRTVLAVSIWWCYFKKSERVRVNFGANL